MDQAFGTIAPTTAQKSIFSVTYPEGFEHVNSAERRRKHDEKRKLTKTPRLTHQLLFCRETGYHGLACEGATEMKEDEFQSFDYKKGRFSGSGGGPSSSEKDEEAEHSHHLVDKRRRGGWALVGYRSDASTASTVFTLMGVSAKQEDAFLTLIQNYFYFFSSCATTTGGTTTITPTKTQMSVHLAYSLFRKVSYLSHFRELTQPFPEEAQPPPRGAIYNLLSSCFKSRIPERKQILGSWRADLFGGGFSDDDDFPSVEDVGLVDRTTTTTREGKEDHKEEEEEEEEESSSEGPVISLVEAKDYVSQRMAAWLESVDLQMADIIEERNQMDRYCAEAAGWFGIALSPEDEKNLLVAGQLVGGAPSVSWRPVDRYFFSAIAANQVDLVSILLISPVGGQAKREGTLGHSSCISPWPSFPSSSSFTFRRSYKILKDSLLHDLISQNTYQRPRFQHLLVLTAYASGNSALLRRMVDLDPQWNSGRGSITSTVTSRRQQDEEEPTTTTTTSTTAGTANAEGAKIIIGLLSSIVALSGNSSPTLIQFVMDLIREDWKGNGRQLLDSSSTLLGTKTPSDPPKLLLERQIGDSPFVQLLQRAARLGHGPLLSAALREEELVKQVITICPQIACTILSGLGAEMSFYDSYRLVGSGPTFPPNFLGNLFAETVKLLSAATELTPKELVNMKDHEGGTVMTKGTATTSPEALELLVTPEYGGEWYCTSSENSLCGALLWKAFDTALLMVEGGIAGVNCANVMKEKEEACTGALMMAEAAAEKFILHSSLGSDRISVEMKKLERIIEILKSFHKPRLTPSSSSPPV